jgi:hypothetical protein
MAANANKMTSVADPEGLLKMAWAKSWKPSEIGFNHQKWWLLVIQRGDLTIQGMGLTMRGSNHQGTQDFSLASHSWVAGHWKWWQKFRRLSHNGSDRSIQKTKS